MEVDIHRLSNLFFSYKKKTTTKKLMCGSLCENMCKYHILDLGDYQRICIKTQYPLPILKIYFYSVCFLFVIDILRLWNYSKHDPIDKDISNT